MPCKSYQTSQYSKSACYQLIVPSSQLFPGCCSRPVEPSINHGWPFGNCRPRYAATEIICKCWGKHLELTNLSKCPLKVSLGWKRKEKKHTTLHCHCWGSTEAKEQEWDVIFAGNSKASQAATKESPLNINVSTMAQQRCRQTTGMEIQFLFRPWEIWSNTCDDQLIKYFSFPSAGRVCGSEWTTGSMDSFPRKWKDLKQHGG